MKINTRANELIKKFDLVPHPEGGYYKQIFESELSVNSTIVKSERSAMTSIYFLLIKDQISRLHRVLHDEIWHFYEGDPITLTEIQPQTYAKKIITLGDNNNTLKYQYLIKGGYWQAACSTGSYSLIGCTVAPGFVYEDFKLLKDDKETSKKIIDKYNDLVSFL